MLIAEVWEFTRPINSSITFGGWPAAGITVGWEISFAIAKHYMDPDVRSIGSGYAGFPAD
jgi:hypothetical protein